MSASARAIRILTLSSKGQDATDSVCSCARPEARAFKISSGARRESSIGSPTTAVMSTAASSASTIACITAGTLTACDASQVVRSISWCSCSACFPVAIFKYRVSPDFRTRKTEAPLNPAQIGSMRARERLDRHDLGRRSRGPMRRRLCKLGSGGRLHRLDCSVRTCLVDRRRQVLRQNLKRLVHRYRQVRSVAKPGMHLVIEASSLKLGHYALKASEISLSEQGRDQNRGGSRFHLP